MSLATKKHLNMAIQSLKTVFNKKIKDSTADWSQNDSDADNYVKNRTHWEETVAEALLPETTLEFTETGYSGSQNVGELNLVYDESYYVTWDGKEYLCTCYGFSGEAIGDNSILTGGTTDDYATEAPFFMWGNGMVLAKEIGTHTFKIENKETVVHKIDEKYLPKLASTPDWNQNDPDGDGYIKNRPFYEETKYVTYIEEQTVTLVASGSRASGTIPDVNMPWDWVPYKVTFDGVEYEGTMTDNADNAWIPITLNSGEYLQVYNYGSVSVNSSSFAGDHTIKVEQKSTAITTIENKYLGIPVWQGEGDSAVCINSELNVASGYASHAEGENTVASGNYSHAEGCFAEASGQCSHTEGRDTEASGDYSHAEGGWTVASGNYSHAEGNGTIASGKSQSVSGEFNIAEMEYISDETVLMRTKRVCTVGQLGSLRYCDGYTFDGSTGLYTLVPVEFDAVGSGLHMSETGGVYCIYGGESGRVMYYNPSKKALYSTGSASTADICADIGTIQYTSRKSATDKCKYVSIVGNGTSKTIRSNAHTLDWNGNAWYQGDVYVGGTSQDDGIRLLKTSELPTEDDAIELATEMGLVSPTAADDGSIYTDENGVVYSL